MIIKAKIITVIALTIIFTVGVTTAVVLSIQGKKMLEAKMEDTVFLGEVVERSIGNAMKDGRTKDVQAVIEEIGRHKEVVHLRVLSPVGTILHSSNSAEIGFRSADYMKSQSSYISHQPTMVNASTISYFRQIRNGSSCQGCHGIQNMANGVIQINLDISRNIAAMISVKRVFVASSVVTVIVVSVILSLLFSRCVMTPLKRLLSAIQEVQSGNWNATVKDITRDELGTIGNAFNTMVCELHNLYKKNLAKERELSRIRIDLDHKTRVEELNTQLEFKIKELETANRAITSLSKEVKGKNRELVNAVDRLKKINAVGSVLTSVIETEEIMKIITRSTADLFHADRVLLSIRNDGKKPIVIHCCRGAGTEMLTDLPAEYEAFYSQTTVHGGPLLHGEDPSCSQRIGVPLRMKGRVIGAVILDAGPDTLRFTNEDLDLLTTLSNQAIVAMENAWLYESVKRNYFSTIQSLVNALEANDLYTKGHSERVKILSLELGYYIGLDVREIEILEHASILHDIGKIGIESFILQKQGKLTKREYGIIKSHPLIGEEILGPIETLDGVRQTILQHHERYDGTGYPYGLRGEELLLKARILSVVDTFDAMMSERPYRRPLPLFQIKQELIAGAGAQFDPYIVASFIEMLERRGEVFLPSAGYAELQSVR